jgi:hypothetical protein
MPVEWFVEAPVGGPDPDSYRISGGPDCGRMRYVLNF